MSIAGTPSSDPWVVLARERSRYEDQFRGLAPANGILTGEQAKKFLLQSQLPPGVLGKIWSLADTDADGKMDINEFSIACKLINLKLRGFEVPPSLPPTLLASLRQFGSVVSSPMIQQPPPVRPDPPPTSMGAPLVAGVAPVQQHQQPMLPPMAAVASMMMSAQSQAQPQHVVPPPIPPLTQPVITQQPLLQMTQPLVAAAPVIPPVAPVAANSPLAGNTPRASVASLSAVDSPQSDWAVPHHVKLKYTQIFNTTDRTRSNFLSGAQARNIMVQSKLPQNILAQIWALSDMDNDGRLGCEEFVLAMHLCEQSLLGNLPPTVLPLDMIPPSFRRPSVGGSVASAAALSGRVPGSRTASISSQGSAMPADLAAVGGAVGPGSAAGSITGGDLTLMQQNSFEDKRKENFEKGQAELERRRKALLDQQRVEREERERKEREESERRERARLEAEKRRTDELERQMRETQERERQLEEERKRELEQRETARREMERQRQLEWEKQRLQELQQQRHREQEAVLKLKARNQTLTIELSSLNDQVKELSQKICDTRVGVSNVKTTIDGMRSTRDTQMQEMSQLKNKLKEQNAKLLQMSQEKSRLDARNKANMGVTNDAQQQKLAKEVLIKNLREKIDDMQREIDGKMSDIENNNGQLDGLRTQLTELVAECEKLYGTYEGKRSKVMEMRSASRTLDYGSSWKDDWGSGAAPAGGGDVNADANAWPTDNWSATTGSTPPVSATAATNSTDLPGATAVSSVSVVKYRALYEFVQRNNDEISFQPGDIINVPRLQTGDPGWLAGEIRGHTGWFPESYVEPLDGIGVRQNGDIVANTVAGVGAATITSAITPATSLDEPTKLEGIEEVPETIPDTTNSMNAVTAVDYSEPGDEWYVASYPYQSVESGDLNFTTGELIAVTKKDGDWWTGRIDANRIGIFPSNYVQPTDVRQTPAVASTITATATPTPAAAVVSPDPAFTAMAPINAVGETLTPTTTTISSLAAAAAAAAADEHSQPDDTDDNEICEINERKEQKIADLANQIASNAQVPSGPSRQGSTKKPEIASVIAPYEATSKEQLSLARGQLIMIRKKTDSGWWEGELQAKGRKRQVGWFPASYVKVMNSSGRISGRTTPVSTSRIQQEVILDKVMALYPYTAANPDELSFLKDDIISVTGRDEAAWWRGELNGVSGLFPSNYVAPLQQSSPAPNNQVDDRMRSESINELIQTEKAYIEDMGVVHKVFELPLRKSRIISNAEVGEIFVNWQEIVQCNRYFLDDLQRRMNSGSDIVGDVIANHLPRMTAYVTFCSKQLESATLLQKLTETSPAFRDLVRQCQNNDKTKGMPLSSFLIKPMQRITKYPLLINKILHHTHVEHDDYPYLQRAVTVSNEFLKNINENVRLKENQERLQWMQTYIQNDFNIDFTSPTNKLGHRKLIHYGILTKVKSGKELVCFLLNDFLILVQPNKPMWFTQFQFQRNLNISFKVYRRPVLIQDMISVRVNADMVDHGVDAERVLRIHDECNSQTISLLTSTVTDCNTWLRNIDSTIDSYRSTVKSNNNLNSESSHRGSSGTNSKRATGSACGRLLVLVVKGKRLIKAVVMTNSTNPHGHEQPLVVTIYYGSEIFPKSLSKETKRKSFGKAKGKGYCDNVYCKVTVGEQEHNTMAARDCLATPNGHGNNNHQHEHVNGSGPQVPTLVWNHSMQFHVRNVNEDVMHLQVLKSCVFNPDEFLGQAKVKISDVYRESKRSYGPIVKKLILHHVDSGEVTLKLDLQLYDSQC